MVEKNKALTLYDMFSISDREGELKALLHEGVVEEAKINKEKKTLQINMMLTSLCPDSFLQKAQDMLRVKYGLSDVFIKRKYSYELLDSSYFDLLKERIVEVHPAARGYLSDAVFTLEDNELKISLPLGGEDFLKPCVLDIKRWIMDEFGKNVSVEFSGESPLSEVCNAFFVLSNGISIDPTSWSVCFSIS